MRGWWFAACLSIGLVSGAAEASERSEYCSKMGLLAEGIMELRQNGGVLSTVMSVAVDGNGQENPLVAAIVLKAFEVPRYSVDKNRARAATDFRNEVELSCFSAK